MDSQSTKNEKNVPAGISARWIAGAAMLLCASAGAQISVNVPAKVEWTDTGIFVEQGDQILVVNATGGWSNSGSEPSSMKGPLGFDGYIHPGTQLANVSLAALIGRVGTSAFQARPDQVIVAPEKGRLYLGMNDVPGETTYGDNDGSLNVVLRATPMRLPDLQGRTVQEARNLLRFYHQTPIPTVQPSTFPKDQIFEQQPPAGTPIQQVKQVDVLVSDGPGPQTVQPDNAPPNYTPPNTVPPDTVPADTVPADTVPADTVPADTVPPNTPPPDIVPPDNSTDDDEIPSNTGTRRADLAVTLRQMQNEEGYPTESASFSFVVKNNGPSPATDVKFDHSAMGIWVDSVISECETSNCVIPAGASITVQVNATHESPGKFSVQLQVTAAEPDAVPDNNSDWFVGRTKRPIPWILITCVAIALLAAGAAGGQDIRKRHWRKLVEVHPTFDPNDISSPVISEMPGPPVEVNSWLEFGDAAPTTPIRVTHEED